MAGHGGARPNAGRRSRNELNGNRVQGRGSIEHAFGVPTPAAAPPEPNNPVVDDNDVPALPAAAIDADNDTSEGPSWRAEAGIQMLVGKHTGDNGFAYNRARGMKQRTGIVKESMSKIDQKSARESVKKGQLWHYPPEMVHGMRAPLSISWKSFFQLK